MRDLRTNSIEALMRLHYRVLDELKERRLIRSAGAPIGEYAELLFCDAFGWERADSFSQAGYDATDKAGHRIQIKARRIVGNGSRQLGSIRGLARDPFDKLAAVLFAKDLSVMRAAILPLGVVKALSAFVPHTNSHKLMLEDNVWKVPGVEDVTGPIRLAAMEQV
jgi:hypothetical protein